MEDLFEDVETPAGKRKRQDEFLDYFNAVPQEVAEYEDLLANASSVDKPISSSNLGFKLLEKMGWSPGAGLGRNLQGMP